jgi:hypothetical protein
MIGGYRILHERCPHCGVDRTAELGISCVVFCFNCKLRVGVAVPSGIHTPQSCVYREPAAYELSICELLRLEAYRGAVRAGIYTDETTRDRGESYAAAR